jgi:hypothetical protein
MKYRVLKELSVKNVDETLFVLDRANSVLHSFNESGKFLWDRLQQACSTEELCADLAEVYDVGLDQARRDIADFLDILEERKLVVLDA